MGLASFREVLEKMLVIVVLPVRKSLRKEVEVFSPHLVSNTCGLLASIVSELTASALGSEVKSMCTPCTHCVSHTHTHTHYISGLCVKRELKVCVVCDLIHYQVLYIQGLNRTIQDIDIVSMFTN